MALAMELMLNVWREACRHLAIADAFEHITELMDAVLAWARRGVVLRCGPATGHPLAPVIPPKGIWADVLAGPLLDGERPIGVLVAAVAPPRAFAAEHASLLGRLLEPCAV